MIVKYETKSGLTVYVLQCILFVSGHWLNHGMKIEPFTTYQRYFSRAAATIKARSRSGLVTGNISDRVSYLILSSLRERVT